MVKQEWCLVLWGFARGWYKIKGSTSTNFKEHVEHYHAEKIQHPEGHVKSIHTCWLDDIANWDSPEQIAANLMLAEHEQEELVDALKDKLATPPGELPMSPDYGIPVTDTALALDVDLSELTPSDRREFRKFQKYLTLRSKYGEAILLKRPFWRKYLGLDD